MVVLGKHESDVVPGSDDRPTGGLSENKYPESVRIGHVVFSIHTSNVFFCSGELRQLCHSNPQEEASRQAPSGTKTSLIREAQTAHEYPPLTGTPAGPH